jgi:hypothetical protein
MDFWIGGLFGFFIPINPMIQQSKNPILLR